MKFPVLKSLLIAAAITAAACLSAQAAPAHASFQTGQDSTKKGKMVKMKKGKKMKMKQDTAGNRAKQDSVR